MSLLKEFGEVLQSGLIARTLDKCSRWVEHRRIMGEPFPGPYSFKYHPWCREVHDADAPYRTVMKSAQMGLTEWAINETFYTIDVLKRDVLYVLPTALNASDFSKSRFNTALMHSPYLKNLFTDTNTIGLKQAGGVNLYIRGSRGDSNLKSIPVSVLVLDEADEMDQKQIWLALERLSGQHTKKVMALSTPTIPNHGIHLLYEQGTQEHFYFKCEHCSRTTELVYPDCLHICGDSITDPDVAKSFLKCKECGGKLEHKSKMDWMSKAFWDRTHTSEDHRSFYINQLYSFTVSPKELAIAYFRGLGDESAMVEFYNSKLGLPYIPDGGQVTDKQLDEAVMSRRYTKNAERPRVGGDRCIVMGVDQGKFLHVVVAEYLQTTTKGDPTLDINAKTTCKVLWEGKLPGDRFEDLDKMMREWQVLACVIDADPQINDARRFARRFPDYVYLCRYRRGVTGKELQESEKDTNAPILTVDRTNWLDASLGRFHSSRIFLPDDVSNEFKENVKALVRTYQKDENGNPRAVYLNTGPDHFAHALNYCEIALPVATGTGITQSIERVV
ncbi:MAG: hypothetical protein E6Q97_38210 [Desulfurellales bacterium]|nr:MAG: hypothetical protein E6Q97_38210 [Desulfurellales bacterium]